MLDKNPFIGYSELFTWLSDCKKLIICDPYILSGIKDNIVNLKKIIGKVTELTVFYSEGKDEDINCFRSVYHNAMLIHTDAIHDRVWIKDESEAKIIGTSFNGIGKKLAFMLDLPSEDLKAFLNELRKMIEKKKDNLEKERKEKEKQDLATQKKEADRILKEKNKKSYEQIKAQKIKYLEEHPETEQQKEKRESKERERIKKKEVQSG